MNRSIITLGFGAIAVLAFGIATKLIEVGYAESKKYRNTIFNEPLPISTKFNNNNDFGCSIGYYYIAYYKNSETGPAKVYYIATQYTAEKLKTDIYHNAGHY